jgi:putative ABC transport system permease protein
VVTLALTIGANTTLFSVFDALLLHPYPFATAARLVRLSQSSASCPSCATISPGNYGDVASSVPAFAATAAIASWDAIIHSGSRTHVAKGYKVSPDLFTLLDARPLLGRGLSTTAGASPGVVLSEAFWRQQLNANEQVIGTSIDIAGVATPIVGVMPISATFPEDADFWAPLRLTAADLGNRASSFLYGIGLLDPNATLGQAQSQLNSLSATLATQYPESNQGWRFRAVPLDQPRFASAELVLDVMLIAAILVLIAGCINIIGLSISHAAARTREFVTRGALGGTRASLFTKVLLEAALIAAAGAVAGIAIAYLLIPILRAGLPSGITGFLPGWRRIGLTPRLIGYTATLGLIVLAVTGLWPALRASSIDIASALRDNSITSTSGPRAGRHLRRFLVLIEMTVAITLVTATALLGLSAWKLQRAPLGFQPDGVATFRLAPSSSQLSIPLVYDRLMQDLERIPGLTSAATVTYLPLSRSQASQYFNIEGHAPLSPAQAPRARDQVISDNYFKVLGVRLLEGRAFTASDDSSSALVAIINRSMAVQFWGDSSPLDHTLLVGRTRYRVVGVVDDVYHDGPAVTPGFEIYRSARQVPQKAVSLVVSGPSTLRVMRQISDVITIAAPNLAVDDAIPMSSIVASFFAAERLEFWLIFSFGVLTCLISLLGLYALISSEAARRSREIAIRVALGASGAATSRLILREALLLTIAGMLVGVIAATSFGHLLEFLLFGIDPSDPIVLGSVIIGMTLAIGLVGCTPVMRVRRMDVVGALRQSL